MPTAARGFSSAADRHRRGFDEGFWQPPPASTILAGRLSVDLRECRYPAANPTGDAYAYLSVRDVRTNAGLFDGWMIASAPALNALDHMRYDVWVLRCTIE